MIWLKLDDLDTAFNDEDVNEMATWPVKFRLVLVFRGGLWRKVPSDILKAWVSEAADAMNFSPEAFHAAVATWDPYEPSPQRNEPLAAALGWKGNRVAVIWNREQSRLHRLLFVRDLQPPG